MLNKLPALVPPYRPYRNFAPYAIMGLTKRQRAHIVRPTEFLIPNCINSSLLPPNYSPLSANYVAQTLEDSTMKHTAQDIMNYVEDNDCLLYTSDAADD